MFTFYFLHRLVSSTDPSGCMDVLLFYNPPDLTHTHTHTPWCVGAPRDWAIELGSCQSLQHHGQRPVPGDTGMGLRALTHSSMLSENGSYTFSGSSQPGAIHISAI